MSNRLTAMSFASGCLIVVSAGLIVSGYTPRRDDLWTLANYAAGVLSALVGMAVWRAMGNVEDCETNPLADPRVGYAGVVIVHLFADLRQEHPRCHTHA